MQDAWPLRGRDHYGFQKVKDWGAPGIIRDSKKGMIGALGAPRDSKRILGIPRDAKKGIIGALRILT